MERNYAEYLLKKIKEDYNLIADDFSRTREKLWGELIFLKNYLKDNEKVLDLGCGNGRLYDLFQEINVDYYGVDFSEKMIKIAKSRYPQANFQVAEAFHLPFPNNFFDKIFSIAVFHHIPSEKFRLQFLEEAKRVLKPNGLLILTVWKFPLLKEISFILKYTILKLIGKTKLDRRDIFYSWAKKIERYYHLFSKNELKQLIKKSKFEVKECNLIKNKKGNRQNIYIIAQKPS